MQDRYGPPAQSEQGIRADFNVRRQVAFEGETWEFHASTLSGNGPVGMHTSLTGENSRHGASIWLDWPNILEKSFRARMNLFPSLLAEPNKGELDPFSDIFTRTGEALQTILVYDSIMVENYDDLTPAQAEDMIKKGNLPKPLYIVLDADRERLKPFLKRKRLGTDLIYKDGYQITWFNIVEMAKQGDLPLI